MIIFSGNLLNEAKLHSPVTIIHDHDEKSGVCICSTHEQRVVEAAIKLHTKKESKLVFLPYSMRGYLKYHKPTPEEIAAIGSMDITFCRRVVEKIPENGSIILHHVDSYSKRESNG